MCKWIGLVSIAAVLSAVIAFGGFSPSASHAAEASLAFLVLAATFLFWTWLRKASGIDALRRRRPFKH